MKLHTSERTRDCLWGRVSLIDLAVPLFTPTPAFSGGRHVLPPIWFNSYLTSQSRSWYRRWDADLDEERRHSDHLMASFKPTDTQDITSPIYNVVFSCFRFDIWTCSILREWVNEGWDAFRLSQANNKRILDKKTERCVGKKFTDNWWNWHVWRL